MSADVKMVKPGEDIYQELFRKFGIKAEESVFIDDSPANIATSKRLGMDGFVFRDDVEELRGLVEAKAWCVDDTRGCCKCVNGVCRESIGMISMCAETLFVHGNARDIESL
ncbi:MAG: HAD-IA family hydrolase [Dorea sp.]|nr:HAD-IA family hydrolase [Dorea sp.]